MNKIKIAILGYGNLAKGVEASIMQNDDMELTTIFTRREPSTIEPLTSNVEVLSIDDIYIKKNDIDVLLLCTGSASDLPIQAPMYVKDFVVVDTFDNHSKIPEHFAAVDKSAKENDSLGIISIGWDPGLFSFNRALALAVLPDGLESTFWGVGVSQGHTNAIKKIDGVKTAVQYTVPIESVVAEARSGEIKELASYDRHYRECYVVLEDGANPDSIANTIKNMPAYFADYKTEIHFIDEATFNSEHQGMPHGGMVIRNGKTGVNSEYNNTIEFSLKLESNPMFTASVLVAYARAAYRMRNEGFTGCKTIFDIPLTYISTESPDDMIRKLL